jgi:dihydroflavonol-4-reductase
MDSRPVLVTGASGHIGAHVVRQLLAQGRAVRALVRPTSNLKGLEGLEVERVYGDVLDRASLLSALKGCSALYHLAAVVAEWAEDPAVIHRTAIDGTANVLYAAAHTSSLERIVYTSSVAAVGLSSSLQEFRNESHYNTEDTTHYSVAKTKSEQLARELTEQYQLPLVIVNPAVVLGPHDYRPTPATQIVVRYLKHRLPIYLDAGANFVHVDDVARGHLLAEQYGRVGERYILGGENLTIRQLFGLLAQLVGRRQPRLEIGRRTLSAVGWGAELVARLRGKPPLVSRARARSLVGRYGFYDGSKAQQELGYTARSAQDTLADAVQWVRERGWA